MPLAMFMNKIGRYSQTPDPFGKTFCVVWEHYLAYILSAIVIDYSYGDPLCCITQFYLNSGSFGNSSGLFSWITNSTELCAWKKFYFYKKKRSCMIYSCMQQSKAQFWTKIRQQQWDTYLIFRVSDFCDKMPITFSAEFNHKAMIKHPK